MKRILLIITVLVSTLLTANAQVFVGGGIGIDLVGGKVKSGSNSTDRPSIFVFQIIPKAGYYVSDDFAIGLDVGLMTISVTTPNMMGNDDPVATTTAWQVGAFARYKLVGTEKLSLLLEGGLTIGGLKSKEKVGSNTTDGNPSSFFTIGVLPVLSYDLSDRLSIEASGDFFRLGFTLHTQKDANNKDYKQTTNNFGFGVNAINPVSDLNDVSSSLFRVGLVFKF